MTTKLTANKMEPNLRILYVTAHWPFAEAYGAQQRTLNVARLLRRFGRVAIMVFRTDEENPEMVRRTQAEFDVYPIYGVERPKSDWRTSIKNRLRHELDASYVPPAMLQDVDRKRVQSVVEQHDVIWIYGLKVADMLGAAGWRNSIIDVDDIPSQVYRSTAKEATNLSRRLLDLRMAWISRRRERHLVDRFKTVVVSSGDDRKYLGPAQRAFVVPNGFARPDQEPKRVDTEELRVGFLGKLTWPPNAEGLKWFLDHVWPQIKSTVPRAQLRIVGQGSDRCWVEQGSDVAGLGWLEDPTEEIATWSMMVVPIHRGGGTRVKIAEAFARKCPIVATPTGAFGYDVRSGEDILIANTPAGFAEACVTLLNDKYKGRAMAEAAYSKFLNNWTWDAIAGRVADAVAASVGGKRTVILDTSSADDSLDATVSP